MLSVGLFCAVAAFCAGGGPAAGQARNPEGEDVSPSELSPAVLQLRRKMLDPDFMPLAFHSMDQIYYTQTIAAPPRAAPLERADGPLQFSFTYDGKTVEAEQAVKDTFTNAMIVVKKGRVVYETYRNFTNEQTRFTSMSAAKSITSILIGMAIDQGAIGSVDDPITRYIPELKGSAYDGVTLRNALDMKTGVDRADGDQLKPGTEPAARREQMLIRNARPMVDEALMVKRKAQPGKTFDYSTLNTTVVGWVLERATGQPITDFTSQWLWIPLGAETPAYWMADGPGKAGRPMTGLGFNATLRDYARIGLMMLNNGAANGRQVVSRKWVQESTALPHPPTAPNSERGYQHAWWTVVGEPAYMADGLGGQYIYVDPATQTVVVKLSYIASTPDARKAFGESMALMRAAAAWDGK